VAPGDIIYFWLGGPAPSNLPAEEAASVAAVEPVSLLKESPTWPKVSAMAWRSSMAVIAS
jgi:hypothetical protein